MQYFYGFYRIGLCSFALGLLALTASGCGRSTGSVSGKVTYQGKPLPGGYVNFMSLDANSVTKTSQIEADGKYSISNLPIGPAKITVQGISTRKLAVAQGQSGESTKTDQPTVTVPAKYSTTEQSGLTYDVKPGAQEFTIELK